MKYIDQEGFTPLRIYSLKCKEAEIFLYNDISSQFVSALCLIALFLIMD
ncbi:MAG: hypothetical protein IPI46_11520 [Bacteroidetes bacterium]|nr:hypothetical protein [Bacteroidota bacterium]